MRGRSNRRAAWMRWLWLLCAAACVAGCDGCQGCDGGAAGSDGGADAAPADDAGSAPDVAPEPEPVDAAIDAAIGVDAGALALDGGSECRLVYGPAEQAFRGPAALHVTTSSLELITNERGRPKAVKVPITRPVAHAVAPPRPASFHGVRWPPCELAGRFVYCEGHGGVITRTTLGTKDTKQVAKGRPGTRIAAAPLGRDHAVVAMLKVRRTTEGDMLQAFAVLDQGEPVRLSAEGAGATVVKLAARGDHAVAAYLDARTAMVPVHARVLSRSGGELVAGPDSVVFVGPPPERGIDVTLARAGDALFALVPMARETATFGMAAIPIGAPPKDDVPAAWSMYPNGLDPAPIGATTEPSKDGSAFVARVRPAERAPGSPRVLELGRLDARGAFTSFGAIASGEKVTDVALATDAFGAVWILYGDPTVTWLERRVCPGP